METRTTSSVMFKVLVFVCLAFLACSCWNCYKNEQKEQFEDALAGVNKQQESIVANDSVFSLPEVTIEGVLKMFIVNNTGDGEGEVEKYRKTDWENEFLAFIVEVDTPMNVGSLVSPDERYCLYDSEQSDFMVVPGFDYKEKEFAAQYAGRRVRAKGTLFVPCADWRYVTSAVMDLKDLTIVRTE